MEFKLFNAFEYLLYTFIISKIPFFPGVKIRRIYFKILSPGMLGKNVTIEENVRIGSIHLIKMEDNVSVMGNVVLGYGIGGKIVLKKGALIGHDVVIVNNSHEYKDKRKRVQDQGYITPHKDIIIGKNVWIGTKAVVLPGVKIGDYSIIGAGSVVTKTIPSNSIAVGIPARVIKKR